MYSKISALQEKGKLTTTVSKEVLISEKHICLLVFVGFLARACDTFHYFEILEVLCTLLIW